MRSLITGAGGFVGSHLRAHLEERGDVVVGVDREVDVTDEAAMRELMASARPEVIYHLAALTHVGESFEHAAEFTRVNVVGTQCVLDAAFAEVPRAVTLFVSSSEVYGVTRAEDQPLHEDFRVAPANPYAASKVEAERVVQHCVRHRGQRIVIARPFNHVGPGQAPTFVVPALVGRLLEARKRANPSIVVGDLSARRDFVDVRDVVRAYRLLVELGDVGEAYHVASGRDVSIAELAERLAERIAPSVRFVVDPALVRPVAIPFARGSYEKLREATGWSPSIPLDVSLDDVIADVVAHHHS